MDNGFPQWKSSAAKMLLSCSRGMRDGSVDMRYCLLSLVLVHLRTGSSRDVILSIGMTCLGLHDLAQDLFVFLC